MELFQLLGTIAIDNQKALAGIDETESKAGKLATSFQKVGSKITGIGVKLSKTVTAGAAAAGTALVVFANKTAKTTDNIDKMSQKIGISRQAYQELDFICSQSGTSVDNLQMGLKTLTNQMQSAAGGGKTAAAAFDKLGLSIYDSSGNLKDQETMMWESMSALQKMENQTEKAALATDLFGRSGSELMPLLNGASGSIEEMKQQAHDLGLVLSDEAIDAGVTYSDTIDQMKRSFAAAATSCGASLLPILTQLSQWVINKGVPAFQNLMGKVSSLIQWFSGLSDGTKKLIGIIAGIAVAIGPVLTVAGKVISTVGSIISIGGKLISVISGLNPVMLIIIAAVTAVIAIGVALYKNWDTIKAKATELKDKISEVFTKIKDKISSVISSVKSTVQSGFNLVKTYIINPINSAYSTVSSVFSKIYNTISTKIGNARDFVKKAIDKMKSFFNFTWSLPKIKLPHFSISGKFSLNPPSIPKFSVEWYKKGAVLTQPTIFGTNPATGNAMVGGEAGAEAVAPIDVLQSYVAQAVQGENAAVVNKIDELIALLTVMLQQIIDSNGQSITIDGKTLIGWIDKKMAQNQSLQLRGV